MCAIVEEKAQAYVAYVTTGHITEGTQPDNILLERT